MIQHIMVMENSIRSLQNCLVATLSVNMCDKHSKKHSVSKKYVLLKHFVLTLESEWYTHAALSM